MHIAERIKALRKSKGLSQEELAERIGVSRQAISKWESGRTVPDPDKIILLSAALEATTDYLLLGKEDVVESKKTQQDPPAPLPLKKRRPSKKAILAAVLGVICLAVLITFGVHRSHALDVAAIVYAPNGKSACVIYDKNIFETGSKDPAFYLAFCLKQYDGLHGGKWEEFRLRLFPEDGGLCIGGTLESLAWATDNSGVLLKCRYNSEEKPHYEFVSYAENQVYVLDERLNSALLHDFIEYPALYGVHVTYETEIEIEFLVWYEEKMVFHFELQDTAGNAHSGIFLITIDSATSFDEGRKTNLIALFERT